MTTLRRRMLEDLQLRGLAPKTQPCYVDAVRHLAHYYQRSPDQLSEEELRRYFLFLLNEKKVAERTGSVSAPGPGCSLPGASQRPCLRPPSRRPSQWSCARAASPKTPPSTRSATPTPRSCWSGECRCGSSRNSLATTARGPTARYTHLTPHTFGVVHATINALMAAL